MSSTLFSVSSMINQNKLRLHNKALTGATERLATGSRLNRAKDDPLRNFESKNITNEVRNIAKARQNSSDGASILQVAEGVCNEVQNILIRIKELSIQAANDTLSSTEREYLNTETHELLKEIDRIAASTTFNTKQIFGNKGDSFSDEQRDLKDWKPFSSKNSNGEDTRAGVLHIGPGGANRANEVKVSLPEISAKSLGLDNPPLYTISLTYQAGATAAIDSIDSAIGSLNTIRSYMGTIVNRMDNQIENLESRNINMNDYLGKISDTDFAKESTILTSSQIKQQAAISILAQSNSRISRVLDILG